MGDVFLQGPLYKSRSFKFNLSRVLIIDKPRRKEAVDIPVILVGGHRTPGAMAKLLEDGTADFISMCRPFIREPGLIRRWKDGDPEKAKCISCGQCFENWVFRPLRCYVEDPLPDRKGSAK